MSSTRTRLERAVGVLVVAIAAAAVASAAAGGSASGRGEAAVVKGGGRGVLTDPDGLEFRVKRFHVRGTVADDGAARGRIRFVWRGSFAEVWGDPVCEGTCDTIVLTGKVTSGSVSSDGTVTLVGTAREIDKRRGEVIFDSEFDEPFTIVAGGSRPDDSFVLQWCLLPPFEIEGRMRRRGPR